MHPLIEWVARKVGGPFAKVQPFSLEAKNEWNSTSTLPHAPMACTTKSIPLEVHVFGAEYGLFGTQRKTVLEGYVVLLFCAYICDDIGFGCLEVAC